MPKKEKHPWRYCPEGEYWRKAHIQPTYTKKDGTVVHEHPISEGCCDNPSKKDQIYSEELEKISKKHFSRLKGLPDPNNLGFKTRGNKYDDLIRGWTRFWNEVFKPKEELSPNIVKALIASESGFRPGIIIKDGKGNGNARGLMQVTDATQKILKDPDGELHDHLVHVDQKDMTDPNLNIAAGVRWLFQKKYLADHALKRDATWLETIAQYKGVLKAYVKNPNKIPNAMEKFNDKYVKFDKKP